MGDNEKKGSTGREWEAMGDNGDKGGGQDRQEGGHTMQQRETITGTMGDKGRKAMSHVHTIQPETRRGTMGDKEN